MTNDRFTGQLRQHLLSTADERPADGQLAAVVERVAVTPQRHSLVARLTWFPGRVGTFPSVALRYGLVALALIGATVAAAILSGGSQSPPTTVFEGTWTSTDPGDGSAQTLVIGEGSAPTVHFEDAYASGEACRADVVKVFTADGSGEISGDRLEASFPNGGGCLLMRVQVPDGDYDYDPATGTLVDGQRLTWVRVQGGGDVPATPRPATPPPATPLPATEEPAPPATATPTDAPTSSQSPVPAAPVPGCIEFKDGGATYRGSAGSLSLTVTLPAAPDTWWHGLRDRFYLVKDQCLYNGSITLEASLVGQVYADSCDRAGTGVEGDTPAAAIAALATQPGHEVTGPSDVTLAGYPASRFVISVSPDFDPTTCTNGINALWRSSGGQDGPTSMHPGQIATVYLVDVDGVTLGVSARYWHEDATPALLAEVEAIVASLQIEP